MTSLSPARSSEEKSWPRSAVLRNDPCSSKVPSIGRCAAEGTWPARPPSSRPPDGQNRSPAELKRGADVDDDAGRAVDRILHLPMASTNPFILVGEPVAGGDRLGCAGGPRSALVLPRFPSAIEDAHIGMAVELHEPEAHGGCVAV